MANMGDSVRRGFTSRRLAAVVAIVVGVVAFAIPDRAVDGHEAPGGHEAGGDVVLLSAQDFIYGTYIIDTPGVYRLTEDLSFNPNSPATLDAAIASGQIPPTVASDLDLAVPVDAYRAGWPLPTQFLLGPGDPFTPGGPLDARYDPAAFGIGFFAAIAIQADDVVLDLNGYTTEQSAEHALLQRFFAVVELADQPFIPAQGPAGFGNELTPATRVTIRNGPSGAARTTASSATPTST